MVMDRFSSLRNEREFLFALHRRKQRQGIASQNLKVVAAQMKIDEVVAHVEVEEFLLPAIKLVFGGVVVGIDFPVRVQMFDDITIIVRNVVFNFTLSVHLRWGRNRANQRAPASFDVEGI